MHSFGFLDLGPQQILMLLAIGILLFGRNLPEVARSIGKGVLEFKKGLAGLESELDVTRPATTRREEIAPPPARLPQRVTASAPKFVENHQQVDSAPPSV
jgi:sec-independent protein translocase protein TatA